MLTITLYQMSAEDNRMNKSSVLAEDLTIQAVLKYPTSIIDPVIEIRATDNGEIPLYKYNYAYIPDFSRYYFVTNMTSLTNGVWTLSLHVDVLMSFRDGIGGCRMRLARVSASPWYNKDIGDRSIKIEPIEDIENVYVGEVSNISNIVSVERCFVVTTINQSGVSFYNEEGDETDFTAMIRKPSGVLRGGNTFTTRWICNLNELRNIASASLMDAENVASYIVSIMAYPIDLAVLLRGQLGSAKMKLGDKEIEGGLDGGEMYYISRSASGIVSRLNEGNPIKIERKYNDFRDFAPYTNFTVYLPYYGNYNIEPKYLYRGVYIDYILDFATGSLSIALSIDGNGRDNYDNLVDNLNTYLGVQIPIDSTNAESIARKKAEIETSGAVNGAIGITMAILGAVLMATGVGAPAGATVSTLGLMTMVGGAASAASAAGSVGAQMSTLKTSAQGTITASSLSPYFNDKCIISRATHRIAAEPSDIALVYGYPSDYIGSIGVMPLGTYVLAEYVHIDAQTTSSLRYSMSTEREEIETKLLNGIII